MPSRWQSDLPESVYDEETDVEQGQDSRETLLSTHDRTSSDGLHEDEASSWAVHGPPANPIIRVLNYTRGKLAMPWPHHLQRQKGTRIAKQSWDIAPRLGGGEEAGRDHVGRGGAPRDGHIRVDGWALDAETLQHRSHTPNDPERHRRRRLVAMAIGSLLFLAALGSLVHTGSAATAACKMDGSCNDITRIWGQYSPEFSVPSDIDPATPQGCTTDFALVLSRHGARYPTAKKSKVYNTTLVRIQNSVTEYGKGYGWLKDYVYNLGADDLTVFGQEELVDSGKAFYKRYKKLAKKSQPFIRSSGSDRVVMSAQNFTRAFYGAQGLSAEEQLQKMLVIPEEDGVNNTLNHGLCDAFEDGWASTLGDDATAAFLDVWVPAVTKRLNKNLPGADLTDTETVYLMDLCPFNTVNSEGAKTVSKFCGLFTKDEWRSYNYYLTLDKFYSYGNGNGLGPTQGVGYVNELIARLTRKAVVDHTSTNRTLDSSAKTFPLDRALYADFSHDNTMTSIFSAMGLYDETLTLSTSKIVEATQAHGFSSAWVVPFAARMYLEKMSCSSSKKTTKEYVRILINDRVMGLKTCGGDKYGRCEVDKFVDSLSFARSGGLWAEC